MKELLKALYKRTAYQVEIHIDYFIDNITESDLITLTPVELEYIQVSNS